MNQCADIKDNKNVISKQELVLIDYFLTNSGKEVIDKLYPDNQFLNFDKDYRIPNIFYDSLQEENNKNLRDILKAKKMLKEELHFQITLPSKVYKFAKENFKNELNNYF